MLTNKQKTILLLKIKKDFKGSKSSSFRTQVIRTFRRLSKTGINNINEIHRIIKDIHYSNPSQRYEKVGFEKGNVEWKDSLTGKSLGGAKMKDIFFESVKESIAQQMAESEAMDIDDARIIVEEEIEAGRFADLRKSYYL